MDLSIVIVSWNVRELLRQCLKSVYASLEAGGARPALEAELFVVDNGSNDGSAAMVQCAFPAVRLLANSENVGFTAANNQALRLARGRHLLLLNPDTEVVGDALRRMVGYLDAHPGVAVVGPRLLNSDGSVQSSRRRFPTRVTGLIESTPLQYHFPHCSVLGRYYVWDRPDDEEQEVDWLVGACIMVRAEAASQVGFLDEGYFMYSEELDWCYRLWRAGWKAVYLPDAIVVHHYGRSSEQNTFARDIHFNESKCLFYSRVYGTGFGVLLRLYILLGFVYQLCLDGLRLMVRRDRLVERRRRLLGLCEVIRWQSGRLVQLVWGSGHVKAVQSKHGSSEG